MSTVYVTWSLSAVVLLAAAALVGRRTHQNVLGIFIDNRNRFSLSQFQITMWTIVVLSLLAGIFLARVMEGAGGEGAGYRDTESIAHLDGHLSRLHCDSSGGQGRQGFARESDECAGDS